MKLLLASLCVTMGLGVLVDALHHVGTVQQPVHRAYACQFSHSKGRELSFFWPASKAADGRSCARPGQELHKADPANDDLFQKCGDPAELAEYEAAVGDDE